MHKWSHTQHLVANHDSTWCHQMDHAWCIWSMYTCSSFDHLYNLSIKSCFCNYQISTHYLPHVLNQGNFKTMILNVGKFHVIKFKWLVMVPFSDTKIHHVALWGILGEFSFIIQTLILAIHYEQWSKMVLDYDTWHNENLPCGILFIF